MLSVFLARVRLWTCSSRYAAVGKSILFYEEEGAQRWFTFVLEAHICRDVVQVLWNSSNLCSFVFSGFTMSHKYAHFKSHSSFPILCLLPMFLLYLHTKYKVLSKAQQDFYDLSIQTARIFHYYCAPTTCTLLLMNWNAKFLLADIHTMYFSLGDEMERDTSMRLFTG